MRRLASILGITFVAAASLTAWSLAERTGDAGVGYLAAWSFANTTVMGALFLLMIGLCTGASWFVCMRRLVEHVVSALPLVFVLYLPMLWLASDVYSWVPGGLGLSQHALRMVEKKQAWLSFDFFVWRNVGYAGFFLVFSELLLHWSKKQDETRSPETRELLGLRMRRLSAVGIPLVGLVFTFASFDWFMALEPTWHSTIYGAYLLAGGFAAALASSAILVNHFGRHSAALGRLDSRPLRHAIGRLLLASVCIWAYFAFSQALLIWIADLPEETSWYITRFRNGWAVLGINVVLLQFAIPFFALLARAPKENTKALTTIAVVVVLAHLLDTYWVIVPALRPQASLRWPDATALVAVVSALALFTWKRAAGGLQLPEGDPQLERSFQYESR